MKDKNKKITGHFHMKVYRNNELVEVVDEPNLVVDLAKTNMAYLLAGSVEAGGAYPGAITQIGFGDDGSTPAGTDTSLSNVQLFAIADATFEGAESVTFEWVLLESEGNTLGVIAEYGLFHENDDLFARKVRAVVNKDANTRLEGTWTIQF